MSDDVRAQNEASRGAWDANAAFWDDRMGDGNRLVETALWPVTERLLAPQAGERILDAACGNGLYARRLSALGASVVAFDFVASLVERAAERGAPAPGSIAYHVVDATDASAIVSLGNAGSFDGALCAMALMDMPVIEPLMRAVHTLLRPGGRFVWSIMHPAFNQSRAMEAIDEGQQGAVVMKVSGYLTSIVSSGQAIVGQPREQPYFERPISAYVTAAVDAGFVIDAMEERSPSGSANAGRDRLEAEFPMVLIVRMRRL
ncbi:MAG: class I SAM-dependent methyltransferase [Dehalococcoidia bacterium]